jgi:hypothetical protein
VPKLQEKKNQVFKLPMLHGAPYLAMINAKNVEI